MNHLMFEDHPLQLIEHDGRLWLSSSDICRALGYSRTDKLSRVFDRHRAEFSQSMTCVVETPILGFSGITKDNRLFSLRGAHLLGMFARTAKGMTFRRWVLDQLDVIEAQKTENRSLMMAWYEAKADLDNQERFASMCGRGLNTHKRLKPSLADRLESLADRMQIKLPLVA